MLKQKKRTFLAGLLAMVLAACDSGQPDTPSPAESATAKKPTKQQTTDDRRKTLSEQSATLFGPLPTVDKVAEEQNRIDLGRTLFFDPRLSFEGDISCNSCHRLSSFGVDNEPTSTGHQGRRGTRNAPSVYNASLHVAQFWDGRSANLAEQVRATILNTAEMAMPSDGMVVTKLAGIPGYPELFTAAFPEAKPPLSFENLANAIASFETGLLTPGRFDAFMQGDLAALSEPEINGLELFINTGCATCHDGPALGGTKFQKMGLAKPYDTTDIGRSGVTGDKTDRGVFKVPSLRNIARTGPYFHDGGVTRLVDAINIMAEYQLGKSLTAADAASIAMFLESLTGTPDTEYIAPPTLPGEKSGVSPTGAS